MSGRGELVPELSDLLRMIAQHIKVGKATPGDAEALEGLAKAAAGTDKRYALKCHRKRGRQSWGEQGVYRRLAMAQAVKVYMDEHQCTNEAAREALSGTFGNTGPETLKKAWQEMAPLLEMDQKQREFVLYFKRLEARGLVKITRTNG